MCSRWLRVVVVLICGIGIVSGDLSRSACGDEPVGTAAGAGEGKSETDDSAKKLDLEKHKLIDVVAKSYDVHRGKEATAKTQARLLDHPLLRWTNPVDSATDGAVYCWVSDEGRPLAMACLYEFPSRQRVDHEFVSLSTDPLTVLRNDVVVWKKSWEE